MHDNTRILHKSNLNFIEKVWDVLNNSVSLIIYKRKPSTLSECVTHSGGENVVLCQHCLKNCKAVVKSRIGVKNQLLWLKIPEITVY